MSLVAYETSDESEEETATVPTLSKNMAETNVKRQRESVKILIPSLKEFEEEEETPVQKKPNLKAGSGLFSLLPPPKNTSTLSKPGFMPHILKSKKEQSSFTPKESKSNHTKTKITSAPSIIPEEQESDDEMTSIGSKSTEESENSGRNDFFWLDDLACNDKSKEMSKTSFSLLTNNGFLQNLSSQLSSTSSSVIQQSYKEEPNRVGSFQQLPETDAFQVESNSEQELSMLEQQSYSFGNYSESTNDLDAKESLLKDKEFLKIKGRKGEFEGIDIIDVNADDQLTDRNEWLMKNLTEETTHRPSRKRHHMPTQQQKRKHQITYLAFQAKEREMDLKNQWSLNSRTRRETQAKYGF